MRVSSELLRSPIATRRGFSLMISVGGPWNWWPAVEVSQNSNGVSLTWGWAGLYLIPKGAGPVLVGLTLLGKLIEEYRNPATSARSARTGMSAEWTSKETIMSTEQSDAWVSTEEMAALLELRPADFAGLAAQTPAVQALSRTDKSGGRQWPAALVRDALRGGEK